MTAQILDPVPLSSLSLLPVQHEGQTWNLYRLDAGEPVIRDLEWAQKLGFVRPADIRPLIKRMAESGRLGVIRTVRKTSSASGGRPTLEFLLTKKQALQVAAKSETEFADALLDDVIAVFLKVTGHGGGSSDSGAAVHLVPAHIPGLARPLDALELTLKAMRQIEADTAAVRVRVDAQDETLAKLGTDVAAVKDYIEHAPLKEPAPPKVIVRYPSADFAIDPERSQKLLEAIAKYGPSANRRTLAERLGIPYGSLTVLFASLIGRGLVVATGYRPYQHHLTPEGLKLLGSDLVIVDRGSAKPKQSAPHAKTKEAKTVPQPQLKLVMPPAPPAPNVPKPTIACGNGTLARVQFRNHMQIIGGCLRWTEQKYQEAYNAIYARMADLGHDPRGKTEMDPKTKKIKKIAPIEYLDRMGWASEAYEISLADYPMSMLAEVAVPRPSDIACHSEVR